MGTTRDKKTILSLSGGILGIRRCLERYGGVSGVF